MQNLLRLHSFRVIRLIGLYGYKVNRVIGVIRVIRLAGLLRLLVLLGLKGVSCYLKRNALLFEVKHNNSKNTEFNKVTRF